ncbi:MAG: adenine phosphoribosyltransferase [Candidatus Micrarchaeaceae archaeon]|jgi:adenine phosphoribosyltransferase
MQDEYIKSKIRDIPDYPKKGILFKDITPLLKDPDAFAVCMEELASKLDGKSIDYIVGIEARGFIIGSALAYLLKKGFIPIRKEGKLPAQVVKKEYTLEYGTSTIEIHKDAIEKGSNVVIVDDLLATGGTAKAAADLLTEIGANITAIAFVVELSFLNGREKLSDYEIMSLIKY